MFWFLGQPDLLIPGSGKTRPAPHEWRSCCLAVSLEHKNRKWTGNYVDGSGVFRFLAYTLIIYFGSTLVYFFYNLNAENRSPAWWW